MTTLWPAGALSLFVGQLVCNASWSWLFFARRRGALALADVLLLLGLIITTLVAFARVQPLAAVLLLPYLAWATFAAALTHALWRANIDQLSPR